METLKARNYIATPADIRGLIGQFFRASDSRESVKGDYLKCLVATTQANLKQAEVANNGSKNVIEVLNKVHDVFYAEVMAVVNETATSSNDRARRTGFARSAKSTLLSWVRAEGHDIMALVPSQVTKGGLRQDTPVRTRRGPSLHVMQKRTRKVVNSAVQYIHELAQIDKTAAILALENALDQLSEVKESDHLVKRRAVRKHSGHEQRVAH